MAKNEASPKNDKGFEESLWDSANRLRGSVESSEYKHVVLSLIFLKFVSDKFEERRAELIKEGKEKYADMVEFYTMKNIFYLPETSRWSHIQQYAKQDDIAIRIDSALTAVKKSNVSLKGALPDNYFSRLGLDGSKLSALIDAINNIDTVADKEEDVVGRVYEYFLGKFAASEGKLGGEFYTPKCVVNLIAEMIEPYKGKIYDPCCGSGGMFVQSLKFVQSHHGNTKDISVYGQEYTATTYKLAKMNLAVRGLSANLGEVPADSFFKDQHPDLKADYIMANPPFNMKDWRAASELVDDSRWSGYEVPPTGNANYAWILHMVSKLSAHGVAGFVLANGSMSTNTSGEGTIRQKLVENDLVDCMIALPGQLFYTTQIPVCLWFLSKSKKADNERGYRNREGETLFIDARKIGSMISRTQKELLGEDITAIAQTYHSWRRESKKRNRSGGSAGVPPALSPVPPSLPTPPAERRQQVEEELNKGYGSCILRDHKIAKIVVDAWKHFDGQRYELVAYVVMPNHVHVMIKTYEGFPMSQVVHSWKSFTAHAICTHLQRSGRDARAPEHSIRVTDACAPHLIDGRDARAPTPTPTKVWQNDYFDRFIRDEQHFAQAIAYIHENPVKANLCGQASEWPWSSFHEGSHA